MLREDYPIFFDETEIEIKHLSWNRSYSNILNTQQTEDGHDDVEVIRRGKSTISASFRCTDEWVSILAEFNSHPSIDVRFYDVVTKDYVTLEMRMESLSVQEIRNSDRLTVTNGTYNVSFSLVEF